MELLAMLAIAAVMAFVATAAFMALGIASIKKRHLKDHIFFMRSSFATAVTGVVLVELFVRFSGGSSLGVLFWVHLPVSLFFILSLGILAFWKTGLRDRALHKKLAKACVASFLVVLVTGFFLMSNSI